MVEGAGDGGREDKMTANMDYKFPPSSLSKFMIKHCIDNLITRIFVHGRKYQCFHIDASLNSLNLYQAFIGMKISLTQK